MWCGDGRGLSVVAGGRGLSVVWGRERVECGVGDGGGLSVVWGTGEG